MSQDARVNWRGANLTNAPRRKSAPLFSRGHDAAGPSEVPDATGGKRAHLAPVAAAKSTWDPISAFREYMAYLRRIFFYPYFFTRIHAASAGLADAGRPIADLARCFDPSITWSLFLKGATARVLVPSLCPITPS
ncbi:hypothetical protein CDD82_3627 [Ophiocordyceps australis]|uniref:Uncharacterized protein n=1 Tax=Ophiocordyceps australis TaxID=1399860 RepID=A0A2C5ZTA9_9HYPO|nr:hypothetical protein CDD82_3627 [Ophiocordyceps australis]